MPITGIVDTISVRLAGAIFDRTGSYDVLFVFFIAAEIAAAILLFATRVIPPVRSSNPPINGGGANIT